MLFRQECIREWFTMHKDVRMRVKMGSCNTHDEEPISHQSSIAVKDYIDIIISIASDGTIRCQIKD